MSEPAEPSPSAETPSAAIPSTENPPVAEPAAAAPPPPAKPSPEELKAAFKAFKKRLKVTQLDADSSFTKSPLSGGKSQILSITPPNQYPRAVWDALVAEGKLKYAGQGMYELR